MKKIENLEQLLIHQLRDLLSVERQMVRLMPRMAELAEDRELSRMFMSHHDDTNDHIKRLEACLTEMNQEVTEVRCEAIVGLITEADKLLTHTAENGVRDAALIGVAQKIQHYEMASYGTARAYAEAIDMKKLAKSLQKTLEDEDKLDKKLSKLAGKKINEKAMAAV